MEFYNEYGELKKQWEYTWEESLLWLEEEAQNGRMTFQKYYTWLTYRGPGPKTEAADALYSLDSDLLSYMEDYSFSDYGDEIDMEEETEKENALILLFIKDVRRVLEGKKRKYLPYPGQDILIWDLDWNEKHPKQV